jgi:hypothetical protein
VLVAGLLVAGSHGVKGTAQSSAALAMVGGDGFTVWFTDGSTQATPGSGTWAHGHGVYDLGSSGPDPMGWWAINTPLDPATVDLARFSWAMGGTPATATHGDDLFSLANGVVRREVLTDGKNSVIYKGGLLELPADVHSGSTWESAGTVIGMTNGIPGGTASYTSQGTATTPPEADLAAAGCLDATLTEAYGTAKLTTSRTWCPGRGMVRFAEDNQRHQTGGVPELSYPIASDGFDWSRLSGATGTLTKLDPVGTSLLSPLYVSRPGVLPDGTVVAGLRTGNDVVAINPATTTGTLDHTTWRAHPGGALLTCVTIGQVTVATTSERRIVAYGPTGVVLWTASTPDSVDQPAIAFGGQLVVTSVDGTVVALDPSTGHAVWRAKMPSELAIQPVASGDTLVVIDENGTTAAFGSDGHEEWRSTEFPASVFAISGGVVVVSERGTGTLRGYDVATGNKLWRAWGPSSLLSLSDLDGVVVAYLGREGAEAFDSATGTLMWMVTEKALDLLVVGNRAVLATTDSIVVLGRDGTEIARIPHGLSRLPQLNVYIAACASSVGAITSAELVREVVS